MGTANFRGQASSVLGGGGAGDTDKEEAAPGINRFTLQSLRSSHSRKSLHGVDIPHPQVQGGRMRSREEKHLAQRAAILIGQERDIIPASRNTSLIREMRITRMA